MALQLDKQQIQMKKSQEEVGKADGENEEKLPRMIEYRTE